MIAPPPLCEKSDFRVKVRQQLYWVMTDQKSHNDLGNQTRQNDFIMGRQTMFHFGGGPCSQLLQKLLDIISWPQKSNSFRKKKKGKSSTYLLFTFFRSPNFYM